MNKSILVFLLVALLAAHTLCWNTNLCKRGTTLVCKGTSCKCRAPNTLGVVKSSKAKGKPKVQKNVVCFEKSKLMKILKAAGVKKENKQFGKKQGSKKNTLKNRSDWK